MARKFLIDGTFASTAYPVPANWNSLNKDSASVISLIEDDGTTSNVNMSQAAYKNGALVNTSANIDQSAGIIFQENNLTGYPYEVPGDSIMVNWNKADVYRITFTGLEATRTYDIKTLHTCFALNPGNNKTKVTINGSSQLVTVIATGGGTQDNANGWGVFTAVAAVNGTISIDIEHDQDVVDRVAFLASIEIDESGVTPPPVTGVKYFNVDVTYNGSSYPTPTNWNTLNKDVASSITLSDNTGAASSITLSHQAYKSNVEVDAATTIGASTGLLPGLNSSPYPDDAVGDGVAFNWANADKWTITLDNLDESKIYTVRTLHAALVNEGNYRTDVAFSPVQTVNTISSSGNVITNSTGYAFQSFGATGGTLSFDIIPNGRADATLAFATVIEIIEEEPKPADRTFKVNYCQNYLKVDDGTWNNVLLDDDLVKSAQVLYDVDGYETPYIIRQYAYLDDNAVSLEQLGGVADGPESANNDTGYPDDAVLSACRIKDDLVDKWIITLTNLNAINLYSFKIFTSNWGDVSPTQDYITNVKAIGNTELDIISADSKENTGATETTDDGFIMIYDVLPEANGTITLEITPTIRAYINTIEISERYNAPSGSEPTPGAKLNYYDTGYTLTGGIVRAKSEIYRKGGQATFTPNVNDAEIYSYTIYGAGTGGSNISSGNITVNNGVWTTNLNEYGYFNVRLDITKGGVTYSGFEERKIAVVPAPNPSNSMTIDVSYTPVDFNDRIIIDENNTEWTALDPNQVRTIYLEGSAEINQGTDASYVRHLFDNLHGTAANPILVINKGFVRIWGTNAANKTFTFNNCEYLYFDGFGEDTNITAPGGSPSSLNLNPRGYGIMIEDVENATGWPIYAKQTDANNVKPGASYDPLSNVHVYGVNVTGCNGLTQMRPFRPNNTFSYDDYHYDNVYIHHCSSYNTATEVVYFGDTANQDIYDHINDLTDSCGFKACAIFRNSFHKTGYDMLQALFCPDGDFDMHDNTLVDVAYADQNDQNSVFAVNDGFGGRIFNNIVIGCSARISTSFKPWYPTYMYNNVFLNCSQYKNRSGSVLYMQFWDESAGQVWDPNYSNEVYIYNNMFHFINFEDKDDGQTAYLQVLGKNDIGSTQEALIKFYNNLTISPNTDFQNVNEQGGNLVITEAFSNNSLKGHVEVNDNSYDVVFNGGYYTSGDGLYKWLFEYDSYGDVDITPFTLAKNSFALQQGTALSGLVSDAPNAGPFPTEGVFHGINEGYIRELDAYAIGPYAATTNDPSPIIPDVLDNFNLRYWSEMCNLDGQIVRTEIYGLGFTGSPQEILLESPFIEYEVTEKDRFEPIFGAGVTITLHNSEDQGNFFYKDLFGTGERQNLVRVYKSNKEVFEGFVNSELYEEEYMSPPYAVTLTASNQLANLEKYTTEVFQLEELDDKISLIKLLGKILALTGFEYTINVNNTLRPHRGNSGIFQADDETCFQNVYIDIASLRKNDGEYYTLKDVLEGILRPFNSRVYQGYDTINDRLAWFVDRYTDLYIDSNTNRKYVQYSFEGDKLIVKNEVPNILDLYEDQQLLRIEDGTLKYQEGYKKFEVEKTLELFGNMVYPSNIQTNGTLRATQKDSGSLPFPGLRQWIYNEPCQVMPNSYINTSSLGIIIPWATSTNTGNFSFKLGGYSSYLGSVQKILDSANRMRRPSYTIKSVIPLVIEVNTVWDSLATQAQFSYDAENTPADTIEIKFKAKPSWYEQIKEGDKTFGFPFMIRIVNNTYDFWVKYADEDDDENKEVETAGTCSTLWTEVTYAHTDNASGGHKITEDPIKEHSLKINLVDVADSLEQDNSIYFYMAPMVMDDKFEKGKDDFDKAYLTGAEFVAISEVNDLVIEYTKEIEDDNVTEGIINEGYTENKETKLLYSDNPSLIYKNAFLYFDILQLTYNRTQVWGEETDVFIDFIDLTEKMILDAFQNYRKARDYFDGTIYSTNTLYMNDLFLNKYIKDDFNNDKLFYVSGMKYNLYENLYNFKLSEYVRFDEVEIVR